MAYDIIVSNPQTGYTQWEMDAFHFNSGKSSFGDRIANGPASVHLVTKQASFSWGNKQQETMEPWKTMENMGLIYGKPWKTMENIWVLYISLDLTGP